jgi:hypothetical protein
MIPEYLEAGMKLELGESLGGASSELTTPATPVVALRQSFRPDLAHANRGKSLGYESVTMLTDQGLKFRWRTSCKGKLPSCGNHSGMAVSLSFRYSKHNAVV